MNCETLLAGGTQNHLAVVVNTTTDKVSTHAFLYLLCQKISILGETKLPKKIYTIFVISRIEMFRTL